MKTFLITLLMMLSTCCFAQNSMYVTYDKNIDPHKLGMVKAVSSKYEWKGITQRITANCRTERQKAHAIYRYLCNNISYDTDYKIYYADECWEKKKGVCNAYSELFYLMAKSIGLEAELVVGMKVNHAWNSVKVDGKWILLDATWGAGYVSGKDFTRRKRHDVWWNVDPYWMLFTHYPDDAKWQLTDVTYSEQDFDKLPRIHPLRHYGLNGEKVFKGFLAGKLKELPIFYDDDDNGTPFRVKSIPMNRNLKVGKTYVFQIKPRKGLVYAVFNNDDFMQNWTVGKDGVMSMKVTPKQKGSLKITVKDGGLYYDRVTYWVE